MTNFIRYKDEIINLDLVASINKSQYELTNTKITYSIIFYGAYLYPDGTTSMIASLKFDNEEIRDKTFDDISRTIDLKCSLDFIIEITNKQ